MGREIPLRPGIAPQQAGSRPYPWNAPGSELTLGAVAYAIFRNRLLIAALIVAALFIGAAVSVVPEPTYRATASIQIDDPVDGLLSDRDRAFSAQATDRFLQTQVDILTSRSIAERVRQSLPPRVRSELPPDSLHEDVSIALPLNSRIVAIAFDHGDPDIAARVANLFAAAYLQRASETRLIAASAERAAIDRQLQATKQRLEASERALIAYGRSAGLIDSAAIVGSPARSDPRLSLSRSALLDLNSAYSTARADRIEAEQQWIQARSADPAAIPEVMANSGVQQLIGRRAELVANLQQELERRTGNHPAVRQARANVAELDRQIEALAKNVRASIEQRYLAAARQERALEGSVAQLRSATFDEQSRGVRYNILQREVDTNRALYDALLQRFKEASADAGAVQQNALLLDDASASVEQVSPQPVRNLTLAAIGGMLLAFLVVAARETLNGQIRTPQDVASVGTPLLGVISSDPLDDGQDPLSGSYFALAASLETGDDPSPLLVTSSQAGEGKSRTALGLATAWSKLGKRVLLVDADLRDPALQRQLDQPDSPGLFELLAGTVEPAAVIRHVDELGFSFLSSGSLDSSATAFASRAAVHRTLKRLQRDYDIVVLDAPSLLSIGEATRLASGAACTVIVMESERASIEQVRFAISRLLNDGARIAGAVLTAFDPCRFGYASYCSYGHGARRKAS